MNNYLKREILFHEKKFFSGEDFDDLYSNHPIWRIHWERKYHIIREHIDQSNDSCTILNVGAGTGPIEYFLNRYGEKSAIDIISTDISKNAMFNIKFYGLNEKLVLCSAMKLPFKDSSFDGVIFSGVLHHLPKEDFITIIHEVQRVLKPKGILIAVEPLRNNVRKLIRLIFPDKWKNIHSKDERELEFSEIHNLELSICSLDTICIKPIGFFIDIFLNLKINKKWEIIISYLYIIDKIIEKTGTGISYLLYIRFK